MERDHLACRVFLRARRAKAHVRNIQTAPTVHRLRNTARAQTLRPQALSLFAMSCASTWIEKVCGLRFRAARGTGQAAPPRAPPPRAPQSPPHHRRRSPAARSCNDAPGAFRGPGERAGWTQRGRSRRCRCLTMECRSSCPRRPASTASLGGLSLHMPAQLAHVGSRCGRGVGALTNSAM